MTDALWHDDGQSRLYLGDARAVLRTLPAESVQMAVTSPPYWSLRSYDGQQDTVWGGDEDCEHQWAPCGRAEGYTGTAHWQNSSNSPVTRATRPDAWAQIGKGASCVCGAWLGSLGLEPTVDLFVAHTVEVFREVRRVLRPDATLWLNLGDSYAGSTTVGAPRPGAGRPGGIVDTRAQRNRNGIGTVPGLKAKDLVGIPWRVAFALQADGWWLRSDIIWAKPNPMPESVRDRPTGAHEYVFLLAKAARYYYDGDAISEMSVSDHGSSNGYKRAARLTHLGKDGPTGSDKPWQPQATRNARSVWSIPTQPRPEAHFATFPDALARRCVLAGSAPGDVVLDPFVGSGTTVRVAKALGRIGWGIDISEPYLEIARRTNAQMGLMAPAGGEASP
jgi:DNA modification methylase